MCLLRPTVSWGGACGGAKFTAQSEEAVRHSGAPEGLGSKVTACGVSWCDAGELFINVCVCVCVVWEQWRVFLRQHLFKHTHTGHRGTYQLLTRSGSKDRPDQSNQSKIKMGEMTGKNLIN